MDIELLFPTAIGIEENFLEHSDLEYLTNKIYDIKRLYPSSVHNNWLSGEHSPYNTILTHNIVKDENFSFFMNKVNSSLAEYASSYNDMDGLISTRGWVNIYQKGNFQEPHSHAGSRYSVVFFPKCPEGSGNIVFQNPNLDQMIPINTSGPSFLTATSFFIKPKENMLLIFKSDLQHYVMPGDNSEDRISIAINYIPAIDWSNV